MVSTEELIKIVSSQKEDLQKKDLGTERKILKTINLNVSPASILTGIRRCGKSTLLRQLMKKIKNFNYVNFEDPRLVDFKISDFERLNEAFQEINGPCEYYFFDEIQNLPGWERIVRGLLDTNKKCIITGSNASLLSRELGTKLTGRHLNYELFPFSYQEMLDMTNNKPSLESFNFYLENGGFPEYLISKRMDLLQNLFKDIINRDIIVRYKLKDERAINKIALFLLSNVGKEFSYNKLKSYFQLGSTNTVISFINYFEECYLLFTISKFSYSLKKQIVNPKKVYTIDTGFSRANSITFSKDNGKILENFVFITLRKKYPEIFYYQEKGECDFVIKQKDKIIEAIQVCYEFNEDNKTREINGLLEALKQFDLKEGSILTYNQTDEFIIENKKIKLIPAWKWSITQ